MTTATGARHNAVSSALLSAAVVLAASLTGSAATFSSLSSWYSGLNKPDFTPPNWIFGPVWTTLYILMAIAFWRVLTRGADASLTRPAVFWFLMQITLNALWSVAFFGLRSPAMGLCVIALMIVAIVLTLLSFRRIDGVAAVLLVPYLAWVAFASVLNAAVWLLNR